MDQPPIDYDLHTFRSPELEQIVDTAIEFFNNTPAHDLPPPGPFVGSGVYALFFTGDYELYEEIAKQNRDSLTLPIYIGKAVPPGWRTARTRETQTPDLYRRLREHTRSIQQATNLSVDDFLCRFMLLSGIESDLLVPVEAALIRRHRPLWNTMALSDFA